MGLRRLNLGLQVSQRLCRVGALLLQSGERFCGRIRLLLQIGQSTLGVGDGGKNLIAIASCVIHLGLRRGELRLQGGELVGCSFRFGVDGLKIARLGAGLFLRA